jgi:mannose-1-phosphate guanylyltransferase / phosphomannomutase
MKSKGLLLFIDNKYLRNLVSAGFYLISPKILKYIKKGVKADFGKDIFPKITQKEVLYGYLTAEYLKDMGTLKRLKEVRRDYKNGRIKQFNRNNKRRAIFLDRDGVINEHVGLLYKIEDFKLLPKVGRAVKEINNSEFLAIVITNQPVIARNLCSIEELGEIHKKMETLLGRQGAKLDAIYYCPHHPDKGFAGENPDYKIECDCRKPKTGLIKKAEKDFNIDLNNSYIVGDSFRDILCGKNAGLGTIWVRTKNDYKKSEIKPDYFFKDLNQAVNFIINKNKKI